MKDIHTLLAEINDLQDAELEKALMDITDFVKEFEGEEEIKPVEEALPKLSQYLLYDEGPYIIMECMISIFRRVAISEETIREIRALYKKNPQGILISTLGNLNADQWQEDIENFVVSATDKFPLNVIHTLYDQSMGKLKPESLELLYDLFLKQDELIKEHKMNWHSLNLPLYTLCNQTQNENYELAIRLLEKVLPTLEKPVKIRIIQQLSYFNNRGIPIFIITAKDEDPETRLETVNSLQRVKNKHPKAKELLIQLSSDDHPQVNLAAIKALSDSSSR